MKRIIFVFLGVLILVTLSCKKENPFVFVETKNGQSVFLDASRGKLVYVDESNRLIDYVDLRPNATDVQAVVSNKQQAIINNNRGTQNIPGTKYSITLSTRFYNNRLLYLLKITPFDDKVKQFARTLSVEVSDENGFNLGEIESTYRWTTIVDFDGKEVGLSSQGSIPITLRNYLEIDNWGPKWSNNY